MKKRNACAWGVLGLLTLAGGIAAVSSSSVLAAPRRGARPILVCNQKPDLSDSSEDGCFSTCGGEIPWPFQTANQVVELADGERYVLMGRVLLIGSEPHFVVDLNQHPWLANSRRRADSSYPLAGTASYWRRYNGRRVQLRAVARWLYIESVGSTDILLESLSDPAVVSEKDSRGSDWSGGYGTKR